MKLCCWLQSWTKVSREMNIAMSSFKIMFLKAPSATSSYKYFPLPSTPPPPQKKSNVKVQAPVVQKADSAIHWINLCPVDNVIALCNHLSRRWIVIFPLDSAIQRLNNLCQLDHFWPWLNNNDHSRVSGGGIAIPNPWYRCSAGKEVESSQHFLSKFVDYWVLWSLGKETEFWMRWSSRYSI